MRYAVLGEQDGAKAFVPVPKTGQVVFDDRESAESVRRAVSAAIPEASFVVVALEALVSARTPMGYRSVR